MDREGQRAEAGIGADVAGRLLAADMLLAGGEGQHPAAPAFGIDGLADEPPRHLADEFLARGEQADIGPAEIQRIADGLALRRRRCPRPCRRAIPPGPATRISVTTTISSAPALWQASASAPNGRGDRRRNRGSAPRRRRSRRRSAGRDPRPARAGIAGRRSRSRWNRAWVSHDLAVMRDAARPTATALPRRVTRLAIITASARGGGAVIQRGVGHLHAGQQRRPGSGTRTDIAACPGRFPADRACRRSGTRRAGSDDRPRRGHDGDRRRRRRKTRHRAGCEILRRQLDIARSTSSSPSWAGRSTGAVEPRRFRHVAIQALDRGHPDRGPACSRRSASVSGR